MAMASATEFCIGLRLIIVQVIFYFSLANYSVAYEETQSNRLSDFRDFVCFQRRSFFTYFTIIVGHRPVLEWTAPRRYRPASIL